MNDFHNQADSDMQRLIDQLVDGELPDDQRQALLESMDSTPNGWRQCALTFLESQALKEVLPTIGSSDADEESANQVRGLSIAKSKTGSRSIGGLLALAASVLVAFGLGFLLRGPSELNQAVPPLVVESHPAVEKPHEPLPVENESFVAEQDIAKEEVPLDESPLEKEPVWRNVALALNDAENGEGVQWPMAEGEEVDLQWLYDQPSALSKGVVEQFEQLGHQVSVVREMLPVRLRDGRQGIVPVDHVELRYVGTHSYQ